MSKKMIIGLLSFMMFTSAVYAAGPEKVMGKVEASVEVQAQHGKAIKELQEIKKDYEANKGDWTKMKPGSKMAYGRALQAIVSSVKGMDLRSAWNTAIYESDFEAYAANALRLKQAIDSGTPEQREAATLQVNISNVAGKLALKSKPGSEQMKALKTIATMDLLANPKAIPMARDLFTRLENGEAVETAVKAAITDKIKGTLEEFNILCPPKKV